MKNNFSDEQLMQAYVGGDSSSFEVLFARHRRGLFTFLLHQVGNQSMAEDLFQDVFVRLIKNRGRYQASGKFKSWLFTIAFNAITDQRRRAKVRETEEPIMNTDQASRAESDALHLDSPFESDRSNDPSIRSQSLELGTQITSALEQLSEDQREVFLLRERANLDYKTIADVTNSGLATVKSRMRYALTNLRRLLSDELTSVAEVSHE